ncbi:MAG TPA: hypothetical protein DCG23_01765, partial [Deltaproteobacteria bacterium]|nr:hypothetical protein [Deltaproteobacteria bacterium]
MKKIIRIFLCFLFAIMVFSISPNCTTENNTKPNMSKINIIPKPKSLKLNTHTLDVGLIDKVSTATNSDSEIKIAKMIQELVSPIKKLPMGTSSKKTPR